MKSGTAVLEASHPSYASHPSVLIKLHQIKNVILLLNYGKVRAY